MGAAHALAVCVASVKYHYSYRFFTYSVERRRASRLTFWHYGQLAFGQVDLCRRHYQVGSLAGAAHLLNDNAGVLR